MRKVKFGRTDEVSVTVKMGNDFITVSAKNVRTEAILVRTISLHDILDITEENPSETEQEQSSHLVETDDQEDSPSPEAVESSEE